MLRTPDRNFYFVGFGSIGQALLPALIGNGVNSNRIFILSADLDGLNVAREYGLDIHVNPLMKEGFKSVLDHVFNINPGDVIINVSVNVSSIDLLSHCREKGWLYIDTSIEDWDDYSNKSNQEFRYEMNRFRTPGPTSVVCHGANPGLITHLMIEGLLSLATIKNFKDFESYGDLAEKLGIQVIQIAEHDTQKTTEKLDHHVFYNTWSVDGLMAELLQKAELGVGSHERLDQRNTLLTNGAETRVKSWTPSSGPCESYLIAHPESSAISDFLCHGHYRPTVYYAYNPSQHTKDSIEEWKSSGYQAPSGKKVLKDALDSGIDELGVLFVFDGGSYWYGSTLSLDEARGDNAYKHNSATSLQVIAGIIGAIEWMLIHPNAGLVEPEQMDSSLILSLAKPYLGKVHGVLTDWVPLNSSRMLLQNFLV